MSAQDLTLLSGVVLLLVFVLVGWYQWRAKEPRGGFVRDDDSGLGSRESQEERKTSEENRTRGRGARQ
jgi:hypothetical protein